MKLIKLNRERRKAPIYPDFKGNTIYSDMRMTRKPHHWMQDILYSNSNVVLITVPSMDERREADERK